MGNAKVVIDLQEMDIIDTNHFSVERVNDLLVQNMFFNGCLGFIEICVFKFQLFQRFLYMELLVGTLNLFPLNDGIFSFNKSAGYNNGGEPWIGFTQL